MRAILLILLLISGQSEADPITVGPGKMSCGQMLQIGERPDYEVSEELKEFGLDDSFKNLSKAVVFAARMIPFSWVQGYVSAQSQHIQLAETDGAAVMKYLENYCEENPLDSLRDATDSLVAELAERAD